MPAIFLISTPTSFKYDYDSAIVQVFQLVGNLGDYAHYGKQGPFERHFYGLQIATSATDRPYVRRYDVDVNQAVSLLSLFFGKHVINHGQIYCDGMWSLPDMLNLAPNPYYDMSPYGGEHTKPPIVQCDWRSLTNYVSALEQLSEKQHPGESVRAGQCYSEALRLLPIDRELAFIRLVQALECMASDLELTEEERFSHDDQLLTNLRWLEGLPDPMGRKIANFLKSRLYQISRGVTRWVNHNIDINFYSSEEYALSPSNLESAILAAYALRSKYVHMGTQFGDYVDPTESRCGTYETIPTGFLEACPDRELRKLLRRSPSFLGLERVVRYSIMKSLNLATVI